MSAATEVTEKAMRDFVRPGLSTIGLIVANAGVLIMFLLFELTPLQLVMVLWCECLWIGVFAGIKLLTASLIGDPFANRWANVSCGAAMFLAVMVIALAGSVFTGFLGLLLMAILFANEWLAGEAAGTELFSHIGVVLGTSAVLLAAHAVSFVLNFLCLGEFRHATARDLAASPFYRCTALLAAMIIGIVVTALLPTFANTAAFGIVVIVAKEIWDLRLHWGEREKFAAGGR